jgi:hypothetical protein
MKEGKPVYDCDVFISGKKIAVIADAGGNLLSPPIVSAKAETPAAPAKAQEAPKTKSWHATLVKVDGKNLLVKVPGTKGQPDQQRTVPTDDKTKFLLDYENAALADLKPDMTLTITPETGAATLIRAHVKGLYGVVVKVEGKNVVIKATKTKKEVTVVTDGKTKVVIEGKPAKLADLKAGAEVKVIPETGTAAKIAVVFDTAPQAAAAAERLFRDTFRVDKAALSDTGRGTYFILEPGYKLILEEGKDTLTITVLDETKMVDGVKTRIVEERETANGKLIEVSRNYFAIDTKTGDAYYFGEDVDMYDADGKVTGHEGSWLAGVNGAKFGLLIPGKPKVGDRYCQEVAPPVAMDRAEVVSVADEVNVPAGVFKNCLKTKESSALESGVEEKLYAPGVGLLKDGGFKLARVEKPKV